MKSIYITIDARHKILYPLTVFCHTQCHESWYVRLVNVVGYILWQWSEWLEFFLRNLFLWVWSRHEIHSSVQCNIVHKGWIYILHSLINVSEAGTGNSWCDPSSACVCERERPNLSLFVLIDSKRISYSVNIQVLHPLNGIWIEYLTLLIILIDVENRI